MTFSRVKQVAWIVSTAILFAWMTSETYAVHAKDLQTVALSGRPPTSTVSPNAFQRFDIAPIINELGQVAFFAAPDFIPGEPFPGNTSVWSQQNGVLNLIAQQGEMAPGLGSEILFNQFFDLAFNDLGQTAFRSRLTGNGVGFENRESIWIEQAGQLHLLLRQGDVAPATSDAAVIDAIVDPFALNNAGQIAVNLEVNGDNGEDPVTAGLWSGRVDELAPIARGGQQAPNTEQGVTFLSQGFEPPFSEQTRINAAGQVAFQGFLSGPGVVSETNGGIWLSDGETGLQLVARNGDFAPGTAGLKFLAVTSRPNLNDAGHVNFLAFLAPDPSVSQLNRIGMWSTRSGELELVFRLGDQAPGTDPEVRFLDLQSPVMNSAGSVAFNAVVTGPNIKSENETGIWSEGLAGPGNLELVARSGDLAPDTEPDVVFANFLDPVINAAGQVAFQAVLSGPNVSEQQGNLRGLWAQDRQGNLELIAREGDTLQIGSGDFRTIDFLLFASVVGDEEGRPSGLNDRGQIAFHARFTDGSGGVFVSNAVAVPEPATTILIICALFSGIANQVCGRGCNVSIIG